MVLDRLGADHELRRDLCVVLSVRDQLQDFELAQRLSSADSDLIRLRDVLVSLRERADAARAAA